MNLNKSEEALLRQAAISSDDVANRLVREVVASYDKRQKEKAFFQVKNWAFHKSSDPLRQKIRCIKVIRENTGADLAMAKKLVESSEVNLRDLDYSPYRPGCPTSLKNALIKEGVEF